MPSHATAQHNADIRRRQLAGEEITAADPSTHHSIPQIDNPASPAEFPATAEEYAPQVNRFAPRTEEEAAQYAADSEARHTDNSDDEEVEELEEEEVE